MMIKWTGLAPWEFEIPSPGSLTSTFLMQEDAGPVPPTATEQLLAERARERVPY